MHEDVVRAAAPLLSFRVDVVGDIVATDEGLAAYNGKSRTAEFTPLNTSSSEWARRLSEVKVEPAPASEKIESVANDDTKPVRKGRAQVAR